MEYKIVQDKIPKGIEDKVNQLLSEGWKPVGGVCYTTTHAIVNGDKSVIFQLTQAMVKD